MGLSSLETAAKRFPQVLVLDYQGCRLNSARNTAEELTI